MKLSVIAAASENNVIGRNNDLPWSLPDDMKFFRKTTSGSPIIMGRKNYESIGRALPKRQNIVISRDPDLHIDGCDCVTSLEDAVRLAESGSPDEAFVIGGGQIYAQSMDLADKLYITRIHAEIEGDVYFPEISPDEWKLVSEEFHDKDDDHEYAFTFQIFERKPKN